MYEFYYDYLKPKYSDCCKLLFTDTDSFCCYIQTEDLYHDMSKNTRNFDQTHPLYTTTNYRIVGKFKNETGSLAPLEFVGVRAKMYSLLIPDNPKESKRAKGTKKSDENKKVRHDQLLTILKTLKPTPSTFCAFQSTNHVLRTVKINKTCLNAFDDKRYILEDGTGTLAYGHYMTLHSGCVGGVDCAYYYTISTHSRDIAMNTEHYILTLYFTYEYRDDIQLNFTMNTVHIIFEHRRNIILYMSLCIPFELCT